MSAPGDFVLSFAGLTLLRPWWLLALLPAGAILWHLSRSSRRSTGNWTAVVDPNLLPHVIEQRKPKGGGIPTALLAGGVAAVIVALSGPAIEGRTQVALRSDAMRVLVADLSPTLNSQAATPALTEVLQVKLLDLLARMPEGQTALVAYAEEPYLVAPPTTDTATLRLLVPELSPDIMPLAGERPERALRMADDILERSGAASRDVVWLSANGNASAATLQAINDLSNAGVRISLLRLGAGSDSPGTTPAHDAILASGGLDLLRRHDDTDVGELVARLARRSALREGTAPATSTPRDIGPWLLPLLLPIAALAFRRGILAVLVLALVLPVPPAKALDIGEWWRRPDRRALQMLQQGDAAGAARHFSDPRWRAVAHYRAGHYADAATLLEPFEDADSLYNRGNALARLNYLDDALQAYEAALRQRPDDPDILHNRDLVRKLRKPPSPPPQSPPPNSSGGGTPPPSANRSPDTHEQEAEQLANQWLRRLPDEPAGLLRRKLMLEHQRRQSGESARPWQ